MTLVASAEPYGLSSSMTHNITYDFISRFRKRQPVERRASLSLIERLWLHEADAAFQEKGRFPPAPKGQR